MKNNIPPSIVTEGHTDYLLLSAIKAEMEQRAGGSHNLQARIPPLYRREIDAVIKTPITRRRSYAHLEKVERTYIGTLVEMMLRFELDLPRSDTLDTILAGVPVDIKHTMGSGWMIPNEAIDHPCILSAADEKHARCYLGLVVARPEYLRGGANRDQKTSLKAEAWENILWLYQAQPYPFNFWHAISPEKVEQIFSARTGNDRVIELFRTAIGQPVMREAIEDVARQKDFMRRLRADGKRGTRNRLLQEGILVLSKEFGGHALDDLNLERGDFVAIKPRTQQQKDVLLKHDLWKAELDQWLD